MIIFFLFWKADAFRWDWSWKLTLQLSPRDSWGVNLNPITCFFNQESVLILNSPSVFRDVIDVLIQQKDLFYLPWTLHRSERFDRNRGIEISVRRVFVSNIWFVNGLPSDIWESWTAASTQIFLFIISSFDGSCSEHNTFICNYYFLSYEGYSYYISRRNLQCNIL